MYNWSDIETALTMREEGFSISNIKKFFNYDTEEILTPYDLLNVICKYYGVHPLMVKSDNRARKYVQVRKMFSYFACNKFNIIQNDAAEVIRKERTVLVHYIKCIKGYLDINDEETVNDVERINELLTKINNNNNG